MTRQLAGALEAGSSNVSFFCADVQTDDLRGPYDEDNPWLHIPEQCVRALISEEEETLDEPTCGPGPFSMRGADLVSDQIKAAGYTQISFERFDVDICIGRDLDEAVTFSMALGPASEILRLAGDVGRERTPSGRYGRRVSLVRQAPAYTQSVARLGWATAWWGDRHWRSRRC